MAKTVKRAKTAKVKATKKIRRPKLSKKTKRSILAQEKQDTALTSHVKILTGKKSKKSTTSNYKSKLSVKKNVKKYGKKRLDIINAVMAKLQRKGKLWCRAGAYPAKRDPELGYCDY